MLYLNENHIRSLGIPWPALVDLISDTVKVIDSGDYAQPLKPYLRYRNPKNRIIAMPAFVGGNVNAAGMKWVASFPDNITHGKPRAHSVTVLNDADTGEAEAVLNASLVSGIRAAAVSGLMLRHFLTIRPDEHFRIGIIGWGPVGKLHYDLCSELCRDRIERFSIYDLRGADTESVPASMRSRTDVTDNWENVYLNSDIIVTCTASDVRYIDKKPKDGSLLLHVSLRDYLPSALSSIRTVVVDDWSEICRENTDIELLHQACGLLPMHTRSLADLVCRNALSETGREETILFCPMGLAAFDIGVATFYARMARRRGVGLNIE